ncbi:MAG: hypothetical protein MJ252_03300 [archaeon]|nr:hypothetical protein [archaeon]
MDKDKDKPKEEEAKKEGKEGELPEQKKEEPPQLVEMKKGDYTVHVLVEEIKNCVAIEADKRPFPRVKCTCLGKSNRTEEVPSPGAENYIFNEHFYFEKTNMTKEMLDSEKILFEIYDTKNTKRENYYGIQEFDFSYIYGRESHALQNYWLALANPEAKDITQVRAYLKISVSVLNESDPRIELEMKESSDSNCFLPTQVKMTYKQLSINIFKAEDIPDMDQALGGLAKEKKGSKAKCDGVLEVKYLGIKLETQVVKMQNQIITWNECISLPVSDPAVSQKIVMTIKDHETIGKDDLVGSIELNIDDVKKGKYEKCGYLDIYGSYVNEHTDPADMMNTNAEIGSRWKGRVLVKITTKTVDKPIVGTAPIVDKALLDEAAKTGRANPWKLVFGIYDAFFLPDKDKMAIRISWADKYEDTNVEKAENLSINFAYGPKKILASTTSDKVEEIPDVFIYLMNKDKTKVYCFQRLACKDIYQNNKLLTIKLFPEMSYGKCNLMDSGLLKIKIGIFNSNLDKCNEEDFTPETAPKAGVVQKKETLKAGGDLEDMFGDDDDDSAALPMVKPEPISDEFKNYTIVAVVYMSKELLPADSNGKSDPYVEINMGKETLKTKEKRNTVNGIWNEKLVFHNVSFNINKKSTWPIMRVKIRDYNVIQAHVDMNYAYVWLANSPYAIDDVSKILKPKWFSMFLPKSNKKQGKLLMSFYIMSPGKEHLCNDIKIIPETKPYTCEFNLLGLRELKPLSLMPVKKAYIKFDLNSLNCTGSSEDTQQPITTIPGDPGPNPTINSVFKFDINLPTDPTFVPELQCEVYDNLLSGMVKSLLGVFTLDIKKVIRRSEQRIDDDLRAAKAATDSATMAKGILGKNFGIIEEIAFAEEKGSSQPKSDTQSNTSSKGMQMTELTEKKDSLKSPLIEENEDPALKVSGSVAMQEMSSSSSNVDPGAAGLENAIRLPKKLPEYMLNNSHYFVIYPVFKNYQIPGYMKTQHQIKDFLVEDEEAAPDSNDFMACGYLLKVDPGTPPEKTKKHYRRIYRTPLETNKALFKKTFYKEYLRRGNFTDTEDETSIFELMGSIKKKILMTYENENEVIASNVSVSSGISNSSELSQKGFVEDKSKVENQQKKYGKFKALLRIAEKKKMENYEETMKKYMEDPSIKDKLKYFKQHEELCKKMLLRTNIIVRVYVLRLWELAKKDEFSESDPFIKIYLGDKLIINESDKYQEDQKYCEWNKYYDIPCDMPGCGELKIECWDYDDLLSDDLIGSTNIDLEDRYFCQKWQALEHKPIEIRPLMHPDESSPQGSIYMWLEMFPTEERGNEKWATPRCIETEPKQKLITEFIVWETEEMEMMDVEGTSDIYVLGYYDLKKKQSTDVHYRCQTGVASFNWRMLLELETPALNTSLAIDVFDNDLFSSDDYICGAKLELRDVLKIPRYLDVPIKFTRDYFKSLTPEEKKTIGGEIEFQNEKDDPEGIKFWVQCVKEGKKGGRVLCSLEIMPEWKAKLNKKGLGRDEPNLDPYLPPPFGRFEFTLNPYKLVNQLVGPKFRRKVYCFCCMCLCCIVRLFYL